MNLRFSQNDTFFFRCLIVLILFLASCGQPEYQGADESTREKRLLERSTLASTVIEQLGTGLLSSGLSQSQAADIQIGAENAVSEAGVENSSDIGILVPPIVKGAELAMAPLPSTNKKLAALETMIRSLVSSLKDRVREKTDTHVFEYQILRKRKRTPIYSNIRF